MTGKFGHARVFHFWKQIWKPCFKENTAFLVLTTESKINSERFFSSTVSDRPSICISRGLSDLTLFFYLFFWMGTASILLQAGFGWWGAHTFGWELQIFYSNSHQVRFSHPATAPPRGWSWCQNVTSAQKVQVARPCYREPSVKNAPFLTRKKL